MVLFVMSYNNDDSYIDPNKIYRTDMNNSTDTNVLNEQVTSLLLLQCTTLHLSTVPILSLICGWQPASTHPV